MMSNRQVIEVTPAMEHCEAPVFESKSPHFQMSEEPEEPRSEETDTAPGEYSHDPWHTSSNILNHSPFHQEVS